MDPIQQTIQNFNQTYQTDPQLIVIAPGRVNLIGEHTDYNEGFVLPVALEHRILIASAPRSDSLVNLYSVNFQSHEQFDLNFIKYDPKNRWINYPQGVAAILQKNGFSFKGANICILGTIPIGAGLSSSAALEVASLITLSRLYHLDLNPGEVIRFAHQAETEFVGVNCGMMDQFISVWGKRENALFLDCRSLENRLVPIPAGISILICDTGIHRELAHSAYNQRREECRQAVSELSKMVGSINSLRDVSIEQFREGEKSLSPVVRKRVRHVVTENERVLKSVEELNQKDLVKFGQLMYESHRSLRDDYEVSCPELDEIVDLASNLERVLGARMTGAGFGGCAICLVNSQYVDPVTEKLKANYLNHLGRSLNIYPASPADGASIIDPKKSLTSMLFTEKIV